MKSVAIAIIAVSLASCAASSGQLINQEQTAALKVGTTTISEVTRTFGNPATRIKSSDGSETLVYTHFSSHVKAATLVPIVGLFAGGSSMQGRTVTLRFDPAGLLVEVIAADSSGSSGPLLK